MPPAGGDSTEGGAHYNYGATQDLQELRHFYFSIKGQQQADPFGQPFGGTDVRDARDGGDGADGQREASTATRGASPSPARAGVKTKAVLAAPPARPRLLPARPRGYTAKSDFVRRTQDRYCKQCLSDFHPQLLPLPLSADAVRHAEGAAAARGGWWSYLSMLHIPNYDCAHYCHYTGYYYCRHCMSFPANAAAEAEEEAEGGGAILPAEVLHHWHFRPHAVCTGASDLLELHYTAPLYVFTAADAQRLIERFEREGPLADDGGAAAAARWWQKIRSLHLLRTVVTLRRCVRALLRAGCRCTDFRRRFLEAPAPTRAHRYLMETVDVWSMADLCELHRSGARDDAEAAATGHGACSPPLLLQRLHRMKGSFRRHILRCPCCVFHSLDVCRCCCPPAVEVRFLQCVLTAYQDYRNTKKKEEGEGEGGEKMGAELLLDDAPNPNDDATRAIYDFTVYSVDVLHTYTCGRCHSVYHRRCVEGGRRGVWGPSALCPICQRRQAEEGQTAC
ncbi:hypothetical protein STCU_12213 [Strigomonas culicis]|uniref:Rubicon Homology domain-containing protein n=1 Tax=Strigomonas culicis TaxID=28005 RepID=S9TE51_9TRYP|nr:hypothetical protein STCU_12213 [Strigomonas culicis]|eukprot:EPY15239.1 hypothetical protein STCU_12213 [Strigomonas culicis]